jgi:tRNA threonylcarbamoyladenosine modification (KEOPS) complex  Pcc1 subunit
VNASTPWTVTITVRAEPPLTLEWLRRALSPELAREVPRASASVSQPDLHTLRIEVHAKDTGSARAAMNTYLGWVHLASETIRRAQAASEAALRP